MVNQILKDGKWVEGVPSNGDHYRVKIPVGKKFGYQEGIYQSTEVTSELELSWCEAELIRTEPEAIALYRDKIIKYKDKLDTNRPEL